MWRFHKLIRVTSYLSGFGMLFFSQWQMELEQFRISGLNILLMEDIRNNHLTCMKPVVNNGINYSSLNWWFFFSDFWSIKQLWWSDPGDGLSGILGGSRVPSGKWREAKKTSHGGESRLKQKTYMCFFLGAAPISGAAKTRFFFWNQPKEMHGCVLREIPQTSPYVCIKFDPPGNTVIWIDPLEDPPTKSRSRSGMFPTQGACVMSNSVDDSAWMNFFTDFLAFFPCLSSPHVF